MASSPLSPPLMVLVVISLVLLVSQTSAAPCDPTMIGHSYSECVNNLRDAVYFWTTPCEPSSTQLPANTIGLPCNIPCDAGTYLPFGQRTCSQCRPGEYSLGGGDVISQWFSFPENMATDCNGPATCQAWQLNGTLISSGNNYNLNYMNSNLRMVAYFTRPTGNKIRFAFMVDAENCVNCDGFLFYIDNVLMTPLYSSIQKWKVLEFNVTQGSHDFMWTYKKDVSISRGADRAYLQFIELYGTSYAPQSCSACPPGSYSNSWSAPSCTPCDYNQYNPNNNQTSCLSCLANQTSYQGATVCSSLPACKASDIFSKREACQMPLQRQDTTFHYATLANGQVKLCDGTSPSAVPLNATITSNSCFCPNGTSLDTVAQSPTYGTCKFCPSGYATTSPGVCTKCLKGTAALKSLVLNDWSAVPSAVSVSCTGDCDAQGWIPRGDRIETGYSTGSTLASLLTIPNISIANQGSIQFTYGLGICGSACLFQLIIDNGLPDGAVYTNYTYANQITRTQPLPAGNYTISFQYLQTANLASSTTSSIVKIYNINISGVQNGGAASCFVCPAGSGTFNDGESSCPLCQPGYYSSDSGKSCKRADPGYFVDTVGSTRQIRCGANTESSSDSTTCLTDCTFTPPVSGIKTFKYDLNHLYSPSTMFYAGTDINSQQYFINLCSREHKNATCFDSTGTPIPTFACQYVRGWDYSVDTGRVIGFLPATDDPTMGLTIRLTEGTFGCPKYYNNTAVPRSTNITMICDLNAGVGAPVAAFPNNLVESPAGSCVYSFIWRSLYACPLCTIEDYEISISDCLNGTKTTTHVRTSTCWEPNPILPEVTACYLCPTDSSLQTCGGHGSCDDATGICRCSSQWSGKVCTECANGWFGPMCAQACPGGAALPCSGHGRCSGGTQGNGTCKCSTGWAGESCDVCDEGFEGATCVAPDATVSDVIPWWGFILLFGGLAIIVGLAVFFWWQKRHAEYRYTSLLRSQPMEMGDDNIVGIPDDDDDDRDADADPDAVERT